MDPYEYLEIDRDSHEFKMTQPPKITEHSKYMIFTRGKCQMDLMEFPEYDGFRYVLNVVDIFTRKCDCGRMKTKTAEEVALQLGYILHRKIIGEITSIYCDQGPEFINRTVEEVCKNNNIVLRATKPARKNQNSIIEHVNGIFKQLVMHKLSMETLREQRECRDWVSYVMPVRDLINETVVKKYPKIYDWLNMVPTLPKDNLIYPIGCYVHVIKDKPEGFLGQKQLRWRHGDLRYEKEPRKITAVLFNVNNPVRYLVDGISNASYLFDELLPAQGYKAEKFI